MAKRRTARAGFPGAGVVLLGAALLLAGCGGAARRPVLDPGSAPGPIALADFLDLSAEEREARRSYAAGLEERAGEVRDPATRIAGLETACAVAPDRPEAWLELARWHRWYGDYLAAEACLDRVTEVLREVGPDAAGRDRGGARRRGLAMRAALVRAWLHHDRAEWEQGADWADAVLRREPGNAAALRVAGVLRASQGDRARVEELQAGIRRSDEFSTVVRWMTALLERHDADARSALFLVRNLRPDREEAAECHRDIGALAESAGEWDAANRRYDECAAVLQARDAVDLVRMTGPRLEAAPGDPPLAVWTTPDNRYVTGSRSAYLAWAFAGFEDSPPGARRDFWAGVSISAAGVYLRLHPSSVDALRIRGLVFARTGLADRARSDLERVAALLEAPDAAVEAELGLLALRREELRSARRHLERSLSIAGSAGAWRDLGLVAVKQGRPDEALDAFGRAVAMNPDDPTAWYNRGLLHLHAKRLDEAEADLARAARLAPDNAEVARLLQQLRLSRGRGASGTGDER